MNIDKLLNPNYVVGEFKEYILTNTVYMIIVGKNEYSKIHT